MRKKKRNVIGMIICSILLILLCQVRTNAEEGEEPAGVWVQVEGVEGGRIKFDDTIGAITDCEERVTKANIPETINGVKVVAIGHDAFAQCYVLDTVTLPSGVRQIETMAFGNCDSLTSIVIPQKVKKIEFRTFWSCDNLESITLPENLVQIDNWAFQYCTSLKTITIPASVSKISYTAFDGCYSLETIYVEDANATYSDVEGVLINKSEHVLIKYPMAKKSVEYTVPSGVLKIGEYAFESADNLKKIIISQGVTDIGSAAFLGCKALSDVELPSSLLSIGGFQGCESLTNIVLPSGVTEIKEVAFLGCSSLRSITLSSKITKIGERAFASCESLTSINIPSSVSSLGDKIFTGCTSLEVIDVSDSNMSYSDVDGVLCNKEKTVLMQYPDGKKDIEYTIPSTITAIESYAFADCNILEHLVVPSSVTEIGTYAFENSTALNSVDISSSITSISTGAFQNCVALKSVDISSSVTEIGDFAFRNCSALNSIDIPSSVTTIGYCAFENCAALNNVKFPEALKEIEGYAFGNCIELRNLEIPSGVTEIGAYAFRDCTALESFVVPSSLKELDDILQGCTSLRHVTIPSGLTGISIYGFSGCSSLEYIDIADDNQSYYDIDGVVFEKESDVKIYLTKYPAGRKETEYTIPSDVTIIETEAFADCASLERVIIPSGVKAIGSWAFWGCSSLNDIVLPSSIKTLESSVFLDCTSLTSITIPDGITEIQHDTFANCTSLVNVTLPAKLKYIDDTVFYNCSSLEAISLSSEVTEIGRAAFVNCSALKGIELPAKLKQIGVGAFRGCNALEYFNVANENTTFCDVDGVLMNKDQTELLAYPLGRNVTNYVIPTTVIKIGIYAFSGTGVLQGVFLPQTIERIDAQSFDGCDNLDIYCSGNPYEWNWGPWGTWKSFNLDEDIDVHYGAVHEEYETEWVTYRDASCTEYGCVNGLVCKTCHAVLEYEEAINATGHSFTEWIQRDSYGIKERTCEKCGEIEQAYIGTLEQVCTRAQMITLLWRAAGKPMDSAEESPNTYVDVTSEDYYYNAVCWNAENTILPITGEKFEGNSSITREDAIIGIYRAAGSPDTGVTEVPFADVGLNESNKHAFCWAYEKGIMIGNEENLFKPWDACTLGALQEFIQRAANAECGLNSSSLAVSLTFKEDTISLEIGEKHHTKLIITPYAAQENDMIWKSSDESVITVDENGTITAVNQGFATITVEMADASELSSSCDVTVKAMELEVGFDLTDDSYAVPNSMDGFSYESTEDEMGIRGYRIPLERYQEVFGSAYTEALYKQNMSVWNGNCFGMAATSALFYKNKISLADYIPDVVSLNSDGYNKMEENEDGTVYLSLENDVELTRLIERYQVWLNSNEWSEVYHENLAEYDSPKEMFAAVLEKINTYKQTFLVMVSWEKDGEKVGHALVVDSAREPETLENGWLKVYVYDPNNPYFSDFEDKIPSTVYEQAKDRYLLLNVENGQWKMDMQSEEASISIGYDDAGTLLHESEICILSMNDLPENFDTKASFLPSSEITSIVYSSENITVYDNANNLLYQREDGERVFINNDIVTESVKYGTNMNESISSGKLLLPKGEYTVNVDKGMAAYLQTNSYMGIVANENIQVRNSVNKGLVLTSEEETRVDVVIMKTASQGKYTSLSTQLQVDAAGCDVSLENESVNIQTAKTQEIDLEITTENESIVFKDVMIEEMEDIYLGDYRNLSLNMPVLYIEKNDSYQLKVNSLTDSLESEIVWRSLDESVVTVSDDGNVHAVDLGTTDIVVAYKQIQMRCQVSVVNKMPFEDVANTSYYYHPVLWAVDENVTTGWTDTMFSPKGACTRAQVVTFLWRAFGSPEPKSEKHTFTDINSGSYYYKAVLWAVENRITVGYDSLHFAPDATVTRAQFVTFLYRAMGRPEYNTDNPFVDVREKKYYYEAVLWAYKNGVTSGLNDYYFGPNESCIRGQVVTFLFRNFK